MKSFLDVLAIEVQPNFPTRQQTIYRVHAPRRKIRVHVTEDDINNLYVAGLFAALGVSMALLQLGIALLRLA